MNISAAPATTQDRIARTYFPCLGEQTLAEPLVLLHGWGNDSRVWENLLPLLRENMDVITLDLPGFGASQPCESWQQAVEWLAESLPQPCVLFGWSLGGMFATRLASLYPGRVSKLITLAANPSFVARPGWSQAMAEKTFGDFCQNFQANPPACLRQFQALEARGDAQEKPLLRWLRNNSAAPCPENWLRALQWLDALDNRDHLAGLDMPSLHLYGANDQLVPAAVADRVRRFPAAQVMVLPDASHAPQVLSPGQVGRAVRDFLLGGAKGKAPSSGSEKFVLDKGKVAASFSRAAASYDSVAHLQRRVGVELAGLLPEGFTPVTIADMGCGTGYFTRHLADRFPVATCTGVDIAPAMVNYAAGQSRQSGRCQWLCADAESLPLEAETLDLSFSNFTYQWCQDLGRLMAEQWRLLKPGGVLAFTTVGPKSLDELRQAWSKVDDYVHVNRFAGLPLVKEAVTTAGFDILTWHIEEPVEYYQTLGELTRELKALGAHNINRGRNTGLTGRKHIQALKSAYEDFRQPQGLPASWEILYVVARKP